MNTISRSEARANGLFRFFTGVPCSRGHISQRNVSDRSCVECRASDRRRYAVEKPELMLQRKRRYRQRHPERYYEQQKNQVSQWRKKNPHKVNALAAHHRAMKLQRTPVWADMDEIESIYARARERRDEHGRTFHVDHIYPLNGRTVSGLHIAENLRIVSARENLSKSNRVPN